MVRASASESFFADDFGDAHGLPSPPVLYSYAVGTRGSILVVDDEPSVLLTYSVILRQNGYDVTGVPSAQEAIRVLEDHNYDLMICDLALEKSHGGFDVVAFARQRYPAMPAIMLTGYATKEAVEEAKGRKIVLLFKPIEVQDLLNSIARVLRKAS